MATEIELAAHAIADLHDYLDDIQDQLVEVREYVDDNVVNEDAYGYLLKPINDAVQTYVVDKLHWAITGAIVKQFQPQEAIWKVGAQFDKVDGHVSKQFKDDPYKPSPSPYPPGHPLHPGTGGS